MYWSFGEKIKEDWQQMLARGQSSSPKKKNVINSEKANSSYQNTHLQRLAVEKLRGCGGGCRGPEGVSASSKMAAGLAEGERKHRAF